MAAVKQQSPVVETPAADAAALTLPSISLDLQADDMIRSLAYDVAVLREQNVKLLRHIESLEQWILKDKGLV